MSTLGLLIRSLQAGGGSQKFHTGAIVAAYCANVRSVLEYCSIVWNGAAKSHTDRIERIQHKFLIWLTVHSTTNSESLSYNSLLSAHSFTSLAARRSQHDLVFLARLFKHQIDSTALRSEFGLAIPARSVRHRHLFAVPFARVETVKNGLFCRMPRKRNDLLREDTKLDLFTDSLYTVRSACKAHAGWLTAEAYPPPWLPKQCGSGRLFYLSDIGRAAFAHSHVFIVWMFACVCEDILIVTLPVNGPLPWVINWINK